MLAHLLCEKTSKLARVNKDYMYIDFNYSSDMYLYEECVPDFKLDAENRRIDGTQQSATYRDRHKLEITLYLFVQNCNKLMNSFL